MVTWQFYLARRRVTDLRRWATARGLVTYEDLCRSLAAIGTTIPEQAEAYTFFISPPPTSVVATVEDIADVAVVIPKVDDPPKKEKTPTRTKKPSNSVKENKADR